MKCVKKRSASRICVSSFRRGHANLLCIDPILVYVLPWQAQDCIPALAHISRQSSPNSPGGGVGVVRWLGHVMLKIDFFPTFPIGFDTKGIKNIIVLPTYPLIHQNIFFYCEFGQVHF